MPRASIIQTNFTAGEISPRLMGRTDIDRYNNAAKKLLNALPLIHGGARRRPGSRYFKATKLAAKVSRLIPFIYSRDAAYMLEFGDGYVRVHGAGGVDLGIELVTSYSEAMLPDIDFAQGADTMFVAHPSVAIQRLRRFSPSSFDFSGAPFTTMPFDEIGHRPAANLTLGSAAVGTGISVTADAGVFILTDVGRAIISSAGVATITAFTDASHVTVNITAAFPSTSLPVNTWYLDASPMALVKPSGKGPEGTAIQLSAALTRAANLTLSAATGSITITADAAVFSAADVGLQMVADDGAATITAFTDSTHVSATTSADFANTTYAQGAYGFGIATWKAEDVGKFVRINGGMCKITSLYIPVVGTSNIVNASIVAALTSTVVAPAQAWQLLASVWNSIDGYPRTLTLHEQRLVAAGTSRFPQTLWGSRTAEYLDFTSGTADTDSYSFTIASDEVNAIGYLAALRNLVVHTYGGEFSVQGGIEKPVTPTNVRVRPESNHGSKGVRPETVGKESVFVQRAGRKIRAMGYQPSYAFDAYDAPDITVLAEHITESGVAGLTYQQEPDPILWAWREDGGFVTCTLDREQSVIGWAQHYTEGWVESMATIPNGDREETWLVVRRTVNGQTVRYIEILDDTFQPQLPGAAYTGLPPEPQPVTYGYTVDCGLAFDNAGGQTTFSVPHLIGCTVDIVADGCVMPQQVVPVSGNVTLPRSSKRTLIGLHFESQIGLLTPEMSTGTGTAQGNSMRTGEITMRFLNSIGAKVLDGDGQEQTVPWRRFAQDILDQAPPLFTGNLRIETLGWERGKSELTIVQDQPLPMHLLSVTRKFTVND